jgi:hypothetical protein
VPGNTCKGMAGMTMLNARHAGLIHRISRLV